MRLRDRRCLGSSALVSWQSQNPHPGHPVPFPTGSQLSERKGLFSYRFDPLALLNKDGPSSPGSPSPSLQTPLGYGTREDWVAIPCRCRQHT